MLNVVLDDGIWLSLVYLTNINWVELTLQLGFDNIFNVILNT